MIGEQRPFLFHYLPQYAVRLALPLILDAFGLCLSFFRWLAHWLRTEPRCQIGGSLEPVKHYILLGSWDLLSDSEARNGDRSTQNKIAIRGTLPHRYSIEPLDGSGLAVRTIFLLSVQEDGHRLVYAIRLDDEFDWSGDNLQTSQLLPEWTCKSP